MSQEIRKCPFCGNKGIKDGNLVTCPTVGDDSCCSTSTVEDWQNAYCWKEIERLREIIKRKDEALETISNEVGCIEKLGRTITENRIIDLAKEFLTESDDKQRNIQENN
jgi:hypothetical protein